MKIEKENNDSNNLGYQWLDIIKIIAISWIVLNHLSEKIFGGPYLGNPSANWPALSMRIEQLAPISGLGIPGAIINIARYLGWLGDHGVQLFLIISGFGLSISQFKHRNDTFDFLYYFKRRFFRIYPSWWLVHLFFISIFLVTGKGPDVTHFNTLLSLLGIRFTLNTMYFISPAWWYIGLILQFYLIFPFLYRIMNRIGSFRFLCTFTLFGIISRAIGLLILKDYLDAWLRGAVFITRLPEFAFGMFWAKVMFDGKIEIKPRLIFFFLSLYIISTVSSITLVGNVFSPFLTGISLFVVLFKLLKGITKDNSLIRSLSKYSFPVFLVHHPLIIYLLPNGLQKIGYLKSGIMIILVLILIFILAFILFHLVNSINRAVNLLYGRIGRRKFIFLITIFVMSFVALLVGGELFIRQFSPQEVLGWGERPSLQQNEKIGWNLIPQETTRLRWRSYDYLVESNSLGFPGKEYPIEKNENTFRIMTLGDAFTSAEGVDTNDSWPRLLERLLNETKTGKEYQVLNFGITGYGPDQYNAAFQEYGPIYNPDMVILASYINDFSDVLMSNEEFQQAIGFDNPPADNFRSVLRLLHLKKIVTDSLSEMKKELTSARNGATEYTPIIDDVDKGYDRVFSNFQEIKRLSEELGSHLFVIIIPSESQVQSNNSIPYPQEKLEEICRELEIPWFNLIDVLISIDHTVYFDKNIHWTKEGHEVISDYLFHEINY